MNMKNNSVFITLACFIIIVAGMMSAAYIINIVMIAGLLAISIMPLLNWFVKKGVPGKFAFAVTILTILIGGLFVVILVGYSVTDLINQLPNYEPKIQEISTSINNTLTGMGIDINKLVSDMNIDAKKILEIARSVIGAFGNLLSTSLIVILFIILILVELYKLQKKIESNEQSMAGKIGKYIEEQSKGLRAYISITALTGLITAIGDLIILLFLGVDFALLWALLVFLFNFIPAVGNLLGLIFPTLLALVQFGPTHAIIVAVGFFIINFITENFVKPKFLKDSLNISLFLIFFSVIFWSWVLGFTGAILAVPLTIILKDVLVKAMKNQMADNSIQ
jgi:predicted PurR-regulated permease PerM